MAAAATTEAEDPDRTVDFVLVPVAATSDGIKCAADLYPSPRTIGKRCMLHEGGRTVLEGGRIICSGNK